MTRSGERAALEALRDAARELLRLESDAAIADSAIAPIRAAALALYHSYVTRFGALNRGELREGRLDPGTGEPTLRWHRPNLDGFRDDPDHHLVLALEVFDQTTGSAAPAPILLRRVHGRAVPVERVASTFEALIATRSAGTIDLDRIAELLDLSGPAAAERALGDLVFHDPEHGGAVVATSDYLAGNVRQRLASARDAAARDVSYERNVRALEAVVPRELGPPDIDVSLGSPLVSTEDIEAFVHDVLGGRVTVWRLPSAAWWKIVPTGRIPRTAFDSPRLRAYDILAAGLNGRLPMVIDSMPGPVPGRNIRRRNGEQSLAAQDRLEALQSRFRAWVWEDADRAVRLCAEHNERFNSHAAPPDLGAGLTFPGLADGIELWPWQREVIARLVSTPATLCAHAVGAGKTLSMIGAAMTARRLGLARKPLITVPAHLVEQVAREARQAFPFGRFLVAGDDGQSRLARAVAARCATGDWDAVIVSHACFAAVPVAPEVERADLARRIARTQREIDAGAGGRYGRALLRRRLSTLHARDDAVASQPSPPITFESLGVDLLLVDEAHYFKRLPITSRREGLSLGSSQRAADLALKARSLRQRRGSLPSLGLFTGTPWSNSVTETFVWQTFVQPDVLDAAGVAHFDAWAAVFVEHEAAIEVSPDGSAMRVIQRPSKIRNLPELYAMLRSCALVLPPSALALEQPERRDDTVVCVAGSAQRGYLRGLAARAEKIYRESVRGGPGEDNMLALCTDARRAALDPHLVGVDEASSKIAAVADRVARIHRETVGLRFAGSDEPGALQIVFCDQGTPGVNGPQTYGRLRIALAERGVPAERIRWVHEARTPRARTALFAACRDGQVAVLLGSTDTLGTGSNVQHRLRAIHHADAPWRPSDVEQREGRALRPGNLNPLVDIVRYVTRGSFDGYMWQTLERKARFIEQLRRGDVPGRRVDDLGDTVLSYAEVKALATGNPLLLEHARAAAEVARLQVLQAIGRQALTAARAAADAAEQQRYRHEQRGRMLRSAATRLAQGLNDVQGLAEVAAAVADRMGSRDRSGSPAPVRAPWRGLGVELVPRGGWLADRPTDLVLRVTLAHRPVDELLVPTSGFGHDVLVTALEAWVSRLPALITTAADEESEAVAAADDAARVIAGFRDEHQAALFAARANLELIAVELEASVDLETQFDPDADLADLTEAASAR